MHQHNAQSCQPLAERTGLPLLHIVDVAGNAITEQRLNKVGLLGTKFVMGEQFHRERLRERYSIDVIAPSEEEQSLVHRIIYEELCGGKTKT